MKAHKINEGGVMKVNDLVKSKRGEHIGCLGLVKDKRVHDLKYTSFTLYKVEFEPDVFEWVNEMYLTKLVKA
jgi:hypothetical protein